MAEIRRTGDREAVDYTARDYDDLLQSMTALIPAKLPEWTGHGSEADFGRVLLELFAHMGDLLSYYLDRAASESFLGTARTRRAVMQHLRLIGYRLGTAAPASAALSLSVPAAVTGVLVIRRGDAFATRSQKDRPSVRFEYAREEDLTIDTGVLPVDASGRKVFFPIPVEEGRLISGEVLGTSDGSPDQRFPLGHPRLVLKGAGAGQAPFRDVILTTELGGVVEPWTLRESLAFSREGQRDFAIEVDEEDRATVLFGDGAFGAIPSSGAVVRATYRVGGGSPGNLPADTIRTIVNAPQLALLGARVTNPAPATGGAERESIEHAVRHAPAVHRSLGRAVTAEDYRALALGFPGVGKVRAEAAGWNRVALHVAPRGGGFVSDVLEAGLLAYFEDRRPLSTLVEIRDVDYVPVHVTAEVGVSSYHGRQEVVAQVQRAAGGLLAFDSVDFGQTLYLSKFYEAIEAIEGVTFVTVTEFRRAGSPPGTVEATGKIVLHPSELATAPDPVTHPDYRGGIRVLAQGGF
jgi:hypothetical protein